MARSYEGHWPSPRAIPPSGDPRALLEDDWRRVAEWRKEADPAIARIEALARERVDLDALLEALARAGDEFPDPSRLAGAGPRVAATLVRSAAAGRARRGGARSADDALGGAGGGLRPRRRPAGRCSRIRVQAPNLKGRVIPLPDWLPASPRRRARPSPRAATDARQEIETLEAELAALSSKHAIAEAIGDFALFEWLQEHAADLAGGTRLVFVTGWTSAESDAELQRELERRGVRGLVRLLPDPPRAVPPLLLKNPRWAKPFEIFARMLGMPRRAEADPSVVLAFVAPLMFGFMFGDVGQGLVLALVGALYGRNVAGPSPASARRRSGDGLRRLFGSVFCFEAVPAALAASARSPDHASRRRARVRRRAA